DWQQAGLALADAAEHAPELVAKGIEALAGQLPEPAASIIGDEAVAQQLAEASPETLRALLEGKPDEALQHLAENRELSDAVIDAAMADPESAFAQNVSALGLTADDLKEAAGGLPDEMNAVELATQAESAEDWRQVGLGMVGAAGDAPGVVSTGIEALAAQLPEGVARTVLGDPDVATQLAEASPEALRALLNGDAEGALSTLAGDKDLRDAVIDAAATDPQVAALMEQYDISADELKQAGDAAPHLFSAIQAVADGRIPDALESLRAAGESAPDLMADIGVAIYEQLDPEMQQTLQSLGVDGESIRESAAALPSLVDAANAVAAGEWTDAVDAVLEAGQAAPGMATSLIQKLGESIPGDTLAGALLSDEAVASALASDPALHEAIGQLLDGQVLEGASALLHNASVRDAVLEVVADDADVAAALEKVGLTSDDLLEAGAASPHLLDAGIALADNDLPGAMESLAAAADAAPGLLEKAAGALYDALPQPVRDKFTELGLTRDELAQAGAALPHFYDAVRAVGTGDAEGALQALANGIGAAPDLVTKAILAIGNQLPEQFGLLRALDR